VLLLFLSLCLIVMYDNLSFSLKSIPFLINIHFDVLNRRSIVPYCKFSSNFLHRVEILSSVSFVWPGVLVAHIFSFLCCGVFLCLFVFVLCVVCPVLQVSLGCPFLISPSVFFNVHCQLCQ
jgi:hypothetical protein